MKKNFILGLGVFLFICLISGLCEAENKAPSEIYMKNYQKRTAHKPSAEMREKISKLFDSKVYHDPYYVSQIAEGMQNNALGKNKKDINKRDEMNLTGLFSEKDAKALGTSVNSVQITTQKKENLKKAVYQDPHGTYVDMLMNQSIQPLDLASIQQIQSVDKNTLKEAQMMATSGGPDFGAESVSVRYQE